VELDIQLILNLLLEAKPAQLREHPFEELCLVVIKLAGR
jgi:hypothetical protein